MKHLLVARGFPPRGRWGSEGYAHDLARGLVARGHRVDVLFGGPSEAAELCVAEVSPGLRTVELRLPSRPGKPFRDSWADRRQDALLVRHLETAGPFDRLHLTTMGGGVSLGLVVAARPRVRQIVVTLTDFLLFCHRGQLLTNAYEDCQVGPAPESCSRCILAATPFEADARRARRRARLGGLLAPLGRLLPIPTPAALRARQDGVRAAVAAVDLFLAPSPALRDGCRRLGVPANKLRDLPYALDPGRYAGYAHRPAQGPLRLGYLGQIAPHKGLHELLKALSRLDESARRALRLVVHGAATSANETAYEAELRQQARDLPVEFAGAFPPQEVARVLSELDVLVVPSLWTENLPLVVLHALACRLPILASRVDGIAPFVAGNAILVPPRDTAAWKDALARIASRPDHVEALRAAAAAAGPPMTYDAHLDAVEALFTT